MRFYKEESLTNLDQLTRSKCKNIEVKNYVYSADDNRRAKILDFILIKYGKDIFTEEKIVNLIDFNELKSFVASLRSN